MNYKIYVFACLFFACFNFVCANTNGSVEFNAELNETGYVIDFNQTYYSMAEFDVVANIASTQHWAEVALNTSEIDFGYVERNNSYTKKYRIQARGTIDIEVVPTLVNENDDIFSNLYLSRTTSNAKKIGDYKMVYNLAALNRSWCIINSSEMTEEYTGGNTVGHNGEQTIRLDLKKFNGVVPFDEPRRNTVKFVITPIWSSVEPIPPTPSP